jgi:hypothetical protein
MSRNIYLYNSEIEQNLNGFDNIVLSQLDDIVNYSVDILFYKDINALEADKKIETLNLILQKVRVGGNLVIKFIDSKILSKMYWDNQISPSVFIEKICNNKNITTPEEINEILDKDEFTLSRVEHKEDQVLVTITRTEVV